MYFPCFSFFTNNIITKIYCKYFDDKFVDPKKSQKIRYANLFIITKTTTERQLKNTFHYFHLLYIYLRANSKNMTKYFNQYTILNLKKKTCKNIICKNQFAESMITEVHYPAYCDVLLVASRGKFHRVVIGRRTELRIPKLSGRRDAGGKVINRYIVQISNRRFHQIIKD